MLMDSGEESKDVTLPVELLERIEQRVQYTEFESVDKYVEHVLQEVLYQVETDGPDTETVDIEESEVEDRLKSLGYLNE